MRANSVHKQYIAIVNGVIEDDEFTINEPIGRPSEESIQRTVLSEGGKDAIRMLKFSRDLKEIRSLKLHYILEEHIR